MMEPTLTFWQNMVPLVILIGLPMALWMYLCLRDGNDSKRY